MNAPVETNAAADEVLAAPQVEAKEAPVVQAEAVHAAEEQPKAASEKKEDGAFALEDDDK